MERHVGHALVRGDEVFDQSAGSAGDSAGMLVLQKLAKHRMVVDAFFMQGVDDDLGSEDGAGWWVSELVWG